MKEYKLLLRDADAPPIIVSSYSVEIYFALGEKQAEKEHVKRCIHPELPDSHGIYTALHSMPESLYESKELNLGSTVWKIAKNRVEEFTQYIELDKTSYPYMDALKMIEGEYFWIIAWDD